MGKVIEEQQELISIFSTGIGNVTDQDIRVMGNITLQEVEVSQGILLGFDVEMDTVSELDVTVPVVLHKLIYKATETVEAILLQLKNPEELTLGNKLRAQIQEIFKVSIKKYFILIYLEELPAT